VLFLAPPPAPVSYNSAVAPILAMRCNGCHGDAGGLDTRSYEGLMAGGHLGKVIVPGDAERSLLVHFIDGRRGKEQRMPLGGRPLLSEEIEMVRRWIAEGARPDSTSPPREVFKLTNIPLPRDKLLRLAYRVPVDAYVTLTVRDPQNRRVLLSWVASVKSMREQVDAGSPGELLHWNIRAGKGWPKKIDAELALEHAASSRRGIEFFVAR